MQPAVPCIKRLAIQAMLLSAGLACLAGQARARSMSLKGLWTGFDVVEQNKINSWKPICGKRPPLFKRYPRGPYKIKTFRKEFNVFLGTRRFLSSYKCNTKNEYVKRREHTVKAGVYSTTCGSSKADEIFEVGTYTFKVLHPDRIDYSEETTIFTTKEGVECSFERRMTGIFVRKGSVEESVMLGLAQGQGKDEGSGRSCPAPDSPRPVASLELLPGSQVLAPGQRACFKAIARDAAGCAVEVSPRFALAETKPGLSAQVDAKGCVTVKDAPSLGVAFKVVAAVGPRQASSKITIGIPKRKRGRQSKKGVKQARSGDVSISIRSLEPSGRVDPEWLQRHKAELERRKSASAESRGTSWFVLAMILAMLAVAGVVLAVALKSHGKADESEEVFVYAAPGPTGGPVSPQVKLELKTCPKCNKTFQSNAKFCPFDRSELRVIGKDEPAAKAKAHGGSLKQCPKCGRMFESRGNFCPFDRAKLEEITAEEAANLPARRGSGKLVCPACKRTFDKGRFCPFDRSELVDRV